VGLTRPRTQRWGACIALAAAAWLAIAPCAGAQSTGSSAGGGSWSSGGGGSSSSSGSSYRGSSSSSSSSANPGYEPPFGVQCLISIAFLVFLFFLFRTLFRFSGPVPIGVSVVQIAIDARARRFVQAALAEIVAASNTGSREGLAKLLTGASRALVGTRIAWIYAGTRRFDPTRADLARATHARAAHDVRARFDNELLRKVDGTTTTAAAPALTPREHEGEGVVVVSLVVASYRTLHAADPTRPDEIERLLEQLATLPARELVALEVIWSPSAEDDRMSTDELEARYPELTRLGARVGRIFCSSCGGPYAAELPRCPHCGAPAEPLPASSPVG
jgi:uncharacterized membrane protein